ELKAEDRPAAVTDGGDGTGVGPCQSLPLAVDRLHLVAVTHPDDRLGRHIDEQAIGFVNMATGSAELAADPRPHLATQRLAGELHAVANAENRDAQVEDFGITVGCIGSVDAGGTAGKNKAARLHFGDARGGYIMADDLAEDILFADPARDQLAVLGAKVK